MDFDDEVDAEEQEDEVEEAVDDEVVNDDYVNEESEVKSKLNDENSTAKGVSFSADTASPTQPTPSNDAPTEPSTKSQGGGSGPQCPNCGSRQIETHDAQGASICTECGVVLEENAIVSSVEFVEGNGGASSMVGQFVSATSSKAFVGGAGGAGGRYGYSRESREIILANGRRKIQELASRLRLSNTFVDGSHRLFTVAVEKNFVQGRRTVHVIAACLYMCCRQEKSSHMLIDFADALQVNVYTLGICFLKFRRLLGLKLEIIDPALYIYRFAAHLELEDKSNIVSLTALRLVARMKRDWIVAGRRPAGVCAAALLIAARAHGFSRQTQDVTKILRICGVTVNNRLQDFERTPSAHLSLESFNRTELDEEADPPIYTKNKIIEARAKAIQENNVELLNSGALDGQGKFGDRWRKQKKITQQNLQLQSFYVGLDQKLSTPGAAANDGAANETNAGATALLESSTTSAPSTEGMNEATEGDGVSTSADNDLVPDKSNESETDADANTGILTVVGDDQKKEGVMVNTDTKITWQDAYPKGNNRRDLVLPDQATIEEQQPPQTPVEAKLSLSEFKESMPESMTTEIEDLFRSDNDQKRMEAIFNIKNKEYIAIQNRKEEERKNAEVAMTNQDHDDIEQAARQASLQNKRRSRSTKRLRETLGANATTEEQLRAVVSNRKVSRKINYDALSSIFDDDGDFDTEGATEELPFEEMV